MRLENPSLIFIFQKTSLVMKEIRLLCLLVLISTALNGQEMKEGINFPPYPTPVGIGLKSENLPVRIDNSVKKYFPPVFSQYGWSCNQASSIGYLLTYELARVRDVSAYEPENQYPPLYSWNFLNGAKNTNGVSYFDSWEVIKANGCPNVIDYPFAKDESAWMSGYEKYHSAMENKVHHNYSLSVGDSEGLQKLKQYLHDRLIGSKHGGLANFQIASGGIRFATLPEDSYNAGSPIITSFGAVVGHAMTIVGYDDSVKMDFNGDGKYTNDLDINGDFEVDMSDWEKGALIVVNSWGKGWADNGKSYVAYNVLPRYGFDGGFWNRSVHLIDIVKDYTPQLAMKFTLVHPRRNSIKVMAGVSSDPDAEKPDYLMEFPLLNYQGGGLPFGGQGAEESAPFEIGLDISPMLSNIEPEKPVRFFLAIIESGGYVYNSKVKEFSVIDYTNGEIELISPQMEVPLTNYDTTFLHVNHSSDFKKVRVKDYDVEFVTANNWHSKQLEAANLVSPFRWELDYGYEAKVSSKDYPEVEGTRLGASGSSIIFTELELPFSFPFYGEKHDNIIVSEDGSLFFGNEFYEYPYVVDPSLIFKIKRGIIPFGQDLVYYNSSNGITYNETDTCFTVFWEAMGVADASSYFFNIACNLYPDGKIEFHYGPVEDHDELVTNYDSGMSRGDGRNYIISPLAIENKYVSNSLVTFDPHVFPDKISLKYTGLLLCRPEEENKEYDIHVRVQDKLNQVAYGVVPLSTINLSTAQLLAQNYPNPFNSGTNISFIIPEEGDVEFTIYDLSGRKLVKLVDDHLSKGRHEVKWNSMDSFNKPLPPGIYIGRLLVNDIDEKVKMLKIAL